MARRALYAASILLVAVAGAGCLERSQRTAADSRPVVAKDAALSVRVERFRCRCNGPDTPPHYEGVVRARRTDGPATGTTAWATPLDGELGDVFGATGADGDVSVSLEGKPGSEVVLVSASAAGGKARLRRFKLASGERIEEE